MAETVNGIHIEVKIYGSIVGSDGARQNIAIDKAWHLTDGAGANKVGQAFWDKSRALNNTSEDLDLAGSLSTFNGDTLGLTDVKVLVAENLDSDSGDNLVFKTGSSNPVTGILGGTSPTLTIPPDGFFLYVSPTEGVPVTAGSADTIAFQTTDNMVYQTLIIGENT